MKTKKFKIALLACSLSLFTIVSCSKEDDNSSNNDPSTIQNNVQSGTWRITKFIDSGTDETYHFTGYDFSFNTTGVLNATNGTNNYNGNWSITDSNSNDDDNQNDLDFNINFSLT